MIVRRSGLLFGLTVLTSCHGTEPQGRITVTVISASSTVPRAVVFEVRNSAAAVAYLDRCDRGIAPAVDSAHGGAWVNVSWPVCIAVLDMSPYSLPPGGAVIDSVVIAQPGDYRLVFGYGMGVSRVLYLAWVSPKSS